MARRARHRAIGPLDIMRNAVQMTGGRDVLRTPSRDPGEVLAELGYSPAQLMERRAQAVT
jgi:hypothetical protein